MKIASADLSLSAAHLSTSRVEVSERLRAWVGARPTAEADRPTPRSVVVSNAARQALDLEKSAATDAAGKIDGEDADIDPRLALIKSIVEMMTGRRIEVMSTTDMATGEAASQPAPPPPDFGIEYDRTETRETFEASTFEASGTIRTADGKDINFSVGLSMSRSETETSSVSLRAGNAAVSKDPLVINFGGTAASLTSQRFRFDLMGDGKEVDMPRLASGSGFLVLDAVESGKVESGRQLFGPASGDGFADLAAYDSDSNGWIDEADPVFGRLGVWTPDAKGGGDVASLGERGVGAVYLGRSATPFTLKEGGADLGAVRSSGIWVSEDGTVGTVQQVDVNV
ncbi:VCBS repeat-containing protein [uncultured Zoogloea sp.]|uniref:VCBS repeat-containing protein n=1 Tax=uncultured Zoogloea sp. TaxID=160237 RepID=UPI00260CF3C6|nr:VCBS repeat-containing protein [uncultured Zoogloea sp.]